MRKSLFSLFILIFWIPAVILSILVWNDYSGYVRSAEDRLLPVKALYYLDQGKKVLALTDSSNGFTGTLYDTGTHKAEQEVELRSDIHRQRLVSYQAGKLVVATKDTTGLQVNVIDPADGAKELVQGSFNIPTFLSSDGHEWRGRLLFAGADKSAAVHVAEVSQAQLHYANLNGSSDLPARPVSIREASFSFQDGYSFPVYEVGLKDGRTAYASSLFGKAGTPLLALKGEQDSTPEALNRIGQEFAAQFGLDITRLLRVSTEYPGQVQYYNGATGDWGDTVKTPEPVYQARLFPLNDQETLIAGSTTEDEINGAVHGYLYQGQTGEFTNVNAALKTLSYDQLQDPKLSFYKEANNDTLYYSSPDSLGGWLLVKEGLSGQISNGELQQWQMAAGEDQLSAATFKSYVLTWNALVVNWVIWLVIPLLTVVGLLWLPQLLIRKRWQKLAEGVLIQGTVMNLAETGMLVNEQPQVRLTVRFTDQGQSKEVQIKQVISYLNPIRPGDQVMISYNRSKHKAILVRESELKNQAPPRIIHDAVLRQIEACGPVNRGQALLLHFEAAGQSYSVPVVQPSGFVYRTGERADLIVTGGNARLLRYGPSELRDQATQLTLEAEITRIEKFPVKIAGQKLLLLEIVILNGEERLRKVNSQFVPEHLEVSVGAVVPVTAKPEEVAVQSRLLQGKQGSASVLSVDYRGTTGDRPLASITVERHGKTYRVKQSIEPVYGVEAGDELWIAYDERTGEAIIVNYAT
ncbi:hypothetical protein KDC22_16885 [Paenibacillus tritici]|uniref:hypothetical protein n=1 Tax=Paenibacillus tritici TaxID=1873425 RepID=UPI001BA67F71|nr:hypothetical protein [Paenibacillus tritici]QUL52152.1 hypothetical protein KDC22_16885 [Paenibacillus tritici]